MVYGEKLVAFAQEAPARLLIDYLTQQKIKAVYYREKGEFCHAVLLLEPEQMEQARQLIEDYLQNPRDHKYQQAAWEQQNQFVSSQQNLGVGNAIASLSSSPFTALVLALCLIVFLLSYAGWSQALFSFLRIQAFDATALNFEIWRLVGPALFHFSLMHLIFNLLWWYVLGQKIEAKFGSSGLFLLFLFAAISSNLAQYWLEGPNFGGLSGVVYALFGFVWWAGWLKPEWGLSLPKQLIGFMLAWLALGYTDLLWVQIANTAHTVGLLSGCVLAWVITRGLLRHTKD
jgi:GlpG protein